MTSQPLRNSLPHGKNVGHRIGASSFSASVMSETSRFSDYFFSLDEASKKRYKQKISLFEGQDPYAIRRDELYQREAEFPDFK